MQAIWRTGVVLVGAVLAVACSDESTPTGPRPVRRRDFTPHGSSSSHPDLERPALRALTHTLSSGTGADGYLRLARASR